MTEAKRPRAVQIDNRLTELFHSRRTNEAGSSDKADDVNSDFPKMDMDGLSWLSQFQVSLPEKGDSSNMEAINKKSQYVYQVDVASTHPFWAPADVKKTRAMWKSSRSALLKDCQKQRKAALRKTIRR